MISGDEAVEEILERLEAYEGRVRDIEGLNGRGIFDHHYHVHESLAESTRRSEGWVQEHTKKICELEGRVEEIRLVLLRLTSCEEVHHLLK